MIFFVQSTISPSHLKNQIVFPSIHVKNLIYLTVKIHLSTPWNVDMIIAQYLFSCWMVLLVLWLQGVAELCHLLSFYKRWSVESEIKVIQCQLHKCGHDGQTLGVNPLFTYITQVIKDKVAEIWWFIFLFQKLPFDVVWIYRKKNNRRKLL